MATVDIQLNQAYVLPGNVLTATGGPYTVSDSCEITVEDTDEAAVRSELGGLIAGGTPAPIPTPFGKTFVAVDLNIGAATKTVLFTVPTGKTLVVQMVVVRNASASTSTADYSFGFNNDATDVISGGTHGDLSQPDYVATLLPASLAVVGLASTDFGIAVTTPQGAPCTADVDLIGYYI